MKEVVIFGTGGHAKVVADIVRGQPELKLVAFYSANKNMSNFLDVNHYHQDDLKNNSHNCGVVAIGDNFLRHMVVELVKKAKPNFEFLTVVHSAAVVSNSVKLGAGSVVMANAVVNPDSKVGEHVILNTSCSVDHDAQLEDFVSIAPKACLGGNVKVGYASAVSIGAVVTHGRSIGSHCVIGAGAVVVDDVKSNQLGFGNPFKVIRRREFGDKYL